MSQSNDIISSLIDRYRSELFLNVLPFWLNHSIDVDRGGFFPCLDENGEIYDRRKFMWLNGRQIWMFARIAEGTTAEDMEKLSEGKLPVSARKLMIESATKAADFMYDHGLREDGQVYFSLTEDGLPYHLERKIFSACFLCLGMGAIGMLLYREEAEENKSKGKDFVLKALKLLKSIVSWSHDPSPLGRPQCPGAPNISPMNVPMILLNLIDELRLCGAFEFHTEDTTNFEMEEKWCIEELLKHVKVDKKIVLENVLTDGSPFDGYDGRHTNPGHSIEAGWFILQYARRIGDAGLEELASNVINWSFDYGWDKEFGGLFYFLDTGNHSPPYLEWNMKLWWPHCESLVAYAMLYQKSRSLEHLQRLKDLTDYTFSHFSAASSGGEWYGYLDREGRVTHRFKGGPYKGCFHVPRALYFVFKILQSC